MGRFHAWLLSLLLLVCAGLAGVGIGSSAQVPTGIVVRLGASLSQGALDGRLLLLMFGDMDNYYLNNAVYLVEDFLKSTKDPYYGGEVAYGDRAEHCWNGHPTRANAYSRLRYHQMFIPRFVERARKTAPAGADLQWRY